MTVERFFKKNLLEQKWLQQFSSCANRWDAVAPCGTVLRGILRLSAVFWEGSSQCRLSLVVMVVVCECVVWGSWWGLDLVQCLNPLWLQCRGPTASCAESGDGAVAHERGHHQLLPFSGSFFSCLLVWAWLLLPFPPCWVFWLSAFSLFAQCELVLCVAEPSWPCRGLRPLQPLNSTRVVLLYLLIKMRICWHHGRWDPRPVQWCTLAWRTSLSRCQGGEPHGCFQFSVVWGGRPPTVSCLPV